MKTIVARRAFTLLEIMVALSLLGVIIVAIYSAWRAIIKGTTVAHEVSMASQRTRITMHTIEDVTFGGGTKAEALTSNMIRASQRHCTRTDSRP